MRDKSSDFAGIPILNFKPEVEWAAGCEIPGDQAGIAIQLHRRISVPQDCVTHGQAAR